MGTPARGTLARVIPSTHRAKVRGIATSLGVSADRLPDQTSPADRLPCVACNSAVTVRTYGWD